MLSPSIRSSANTATLVKGTTNEPPLGGTPNQSPPLVPRRKPHETIASSPNAKARIVRAQVRKGGEVRDVCGSCRHLPFTSRTERDCLQVTVFGEGPHDRVEI